MWTARLFVVVIATLTTVTTAQFRREYSSSVESGESPHEHHSRRMSSQHLFNLLFGVTTGSVRPWWEGPNVCETEKIEEKNATEIAKERDGGVNVARHFSSSFHTCDESESVYKCVITEQNQDGYRKVVILYECCRGYQRQKGDDGCPRRIQLRNLLTLANDLGLSDFLSTVRRVGLEEELRAREVTVFAPVNGGFETASGTDGSTVLLQRDAPYSMIIETDNAGRRAQSEIQSAILGHVISGARRTSSFLDEEIVETGTLDASGLRINFFYTPNKIMTANCVPVQSRDNRASNGVIHTVERFLPQVTESFMDMVRSRPDLSTLKTALAAARYVPKLDEDGQGTLLAPSNYAFDRMSESLKQRLLFGDSKCLQKVLDNHILPHTICSAAIQGKARTPNLLGQYLNISRSEEGKVFVHGAQVTQRDIMATNGVMHVIDKVLVPKEAMDIVDILEQEGFTSLIGLIQQAGLFKTLEKADNVTIFAPTNAAIQKLPADLRNQLTTNPELLKQVLSFHVSPGAEGRNYLHGNQLLPTLAQNKDIRIDTYSLHPFHRYGVMTAQCVPLTATKYNACNGRIRVLDDVMIPPRGNVLDVLALDRKFSVLVSLIKRAELGDALQANGPFTIFAPNNRAFEALGQRTLEELGRDPEQLKAILKRHVIQDNLCCAGILRGHSWYGYSSVTTLSGDRLRVSRAYDNTPTVAQTRILTCDTTATNGNVLEVERVLQAPSRRHGYRRRWYWGPWER